MINRSKIEALDPCKDRLNNYIEHYGEREFTKAQFMGLRSITQEDKIWVAFRLMPLDNIKLAAADIAESVLHLYESKYPNDTRPRDAITAARKGDKSAAYYTAYTAYTANAANAAANAAYAAAYAAYYTDYAAYAAAYYTANAAYAAAYYAANAADKKGLQQKLIRKICLKYWKESK